jgi:signal transduction histidine kinase
VRPNLRYRGLVAAFEPFACEPGDSDESRVRKAQFTLAMTLIVPAGLVWGVIYLLAGERLAALLPLAYSVLSMTNLFLLRRHRHFRAYQVTELALIVALPFLLQLALGGYVAGSAVVIWALLGALFAVLFTSTREAMVWFGVFIAAVIVAGIAQPSLSAGDNMPHWLIALLFVMNVGAVSTISFAMLVSFVRARSQLRALELAYLDQTIMLREREKLATLGTLAAGVAHELNNPAAAVRRASAQLTSTLDDLRTRLVDLALGDGDATGRDALGQLLQVRRDGESDHDGARLSALELSDREQAMEDWLDDHGVDEPWELASSFVAMGVRPKDLEPLASQLDERRLSSLLAFIAHGHELTGLAALVGDGSQRISDIVASMRSYSYLDRGDVQVVDVTEGLDSTLVLLGSQLTGMEVRREYAPDLPLVPVHGTELNQVWTNIIANAVDATGGSGTLTIRTAREDDRVVVELEDDGPGMAPGVAERVFEPFFTTKPPGKGVGLGLNVSYNIVTGTHGGELTVRSSPGSTVFRVALPLESPDAERAAADVPGAARAGDGAAFDDTTPDDATQDDATPADATQAGATPAADAANPSPNESVPPSSVEVASEA